MSPTATSTLRTSPSTSAKISCSIFIASSTRMAWPATTQSWRSCQTATTVPANGATTATSDTARTLRDRRPNRRQDLLGSGGVTGIGRHVRPGDVAIRGDDQRATELVGVADRAPLDGLLAQAGDGALRHHPGVP